VYPSVARASRPVKYLVLATAAVFASSLVLPPVAVCQTGTGAGQDEAIYDTFQEIIKLRADGDYDRAIAELRDVVRQYANSEQVLRRAYNHLVTTYVVKGDEAGAMQVARDALEMFPDLTAEEIAFPPRVNEYYDKLREEMFGSLTIKGTKDARVLLDEKHIGDTPLHRDLVRVGEHDLTVTKPGHQDHKERIRIQPGVTLDTKVELSKPWAWWVYALGFGAVYAVALIVVANGNEPEPVPPGELPDPPPPPTN
jgi:hypothetical protein